MIAAATCSLVLFAVYATATRIARGRAVRMLEPVWFGADGFGDSGFGDAVSG